MRGNDIKVCHLHAARSPVHVVNRVPRYKADRSIPYACEQHVVSGLFAQHIATELVRGASKVTRIALAQIVSEQGSENVGIGNRCPANLHGALSVVSRLAAQDDTPSSYQS